MHRHSVDHHTAAVSHPEVDRVADGVCIVHQTLQRSGHMFHLVTATDAHDVAGTQGFAGLLQQLALCCGGLDALAGGVARRDRCVGHQQLQQLAR